jgi:two-component system, OmpR family, sensor histidine kinase BaeS
VKFTLGARLFLAVLGSFLSIGAVGLELVRWNVSAQSPHVAAADSALAVRLRDELEQRYHEHQDWSFLPADPSQRKAWLGGQVALLQAAQDAAVPVTSAALRYRIGLLDAGQHLLTGSAAHRLLIVAASLDRVSYGLYGDGRAIGTLVVAKADSQDTDLVVAFLIAQQRNLAILAATCLGLAVVASALLSASFRRPIQRLVEGARRLGAGHIETRLNLHRSDELGELARTFDQVAAQLEAAEGSRREWVANTSHELRTPLAVLRAQLEALRDGVRAPSPENIELVVRQALTLGKLVDDLGALARSDTGMLEYSLAPVDLWAVVTEAAQAFADRFAVAGLAVALGPAPAPGIVHGDGGRLRQVVVNLLENCLRYTDRNGRVDIAGEVSGATLRVTVDDSSPGVPPAALARLGERFYRVDASRSRQRGGAGLGLALCRQILEAHGGRLDFAASPLGGLRATFSLRLAA